MEKVVLAYSGGLDTSIAIKWMAENYGVDTIALTVDVGSNNKDLSQVQERAIKTGALKAIVIDARETFVNHFVFPALQAGAIYEDSYPLATALARPLIAKLLVDIAREEGATTVAHGCTAKGNDQVRFDASVMALAPDLKIIGPTREWKMTREEEIAYAQKHDIPIPVTKESPYSIDVNLWGRSCEAGILEDPWTEPPADSFEWTKSPDQAPAEPLYLTIDFEQGLPVALNGEKMSGVDLILKLNDLAGEYGVGRIDHIENRLVGIKSRETYEAPSAVVLLQAHQALEDLTMSKDAARFKKMVTQTYSDMVYNGLWFSQLHQDLAAYVASSQRFVTGSVRMKLWRGTCSIAGRKSPYSLYNLGLATYDKGDVFQHEAAVGFIRLWGLSQQNQAAAQTLSPIDAVKSMNPPRDVKVAK
ncbi:MAG: argininosuccinate synthase [Candidatus Marsarchaeota archaeon]|nr:argininosuccinate synthase [Candidatus Marsarchaeota archaeon]